MKTQSSKWISSPLGQVANLVMGQSPDSKFYSEVEIGLPFLQGCAEFQARFPRHKVFCSQIKKVAPQNSILFSVRAPVGRINIADKPYIIGRGLAAITGTEVDQGYLEQYLFFKESSFRNASQGSTFEAINSNELNIWPIEHPIDKLEQTKIAEVLSKVDLAIEQTEQLIAKQQRIKTGLMQDLLTRGIDEEGNLRSEETHKFKDSPLGRIPVEWEVKTLGMALRHYRGFLQTGPFGSQLHAHEYVQEGIPVIMPQNIIRGEVDTASIARITEDKANSLYRHRVQPNDIVFSRRGDLTRASAMSAREAGWLCGTGCFLLRVPAHHMNSNWFSHAYQFYLVQRQIDANAVGSTMPSLNNTVMESLIVPFPSIDEQNEIVHKIDIVNSTNTIWLKHLGKLNAIKTALMQDLLTGKVRVTPLMENTEAPL